MAIETKAAVPVALAMSLSGEEEGGEGSRGIRTTTTKQTGASNVISTGERDAHRLLQRCAEGLQPAQVIPPYRLPSNTHFRSSFGTLRHAIAPASTKYLSAVSSMPWEGIIM